MNEKQAKVLFDKYVQGTCTPRERELLERYLDSFQGHESWGAPEFDGIKQQKVWSDIVTRTAEQEPHGGKLIHWFGKRQLWKYAAVLAGLVFGVFMYTTQHNGGVQQDELAMEADKIMLKTDSETYNELDARVNGEIRNAEGQLIASQQGDVVVYQPGNTSSKEPIYHELIVPLGKTFKLVLSDGTAVHLNSGSAFRFPVHFMEGADRTVSLKGEAYFEVAKDEKHPFIVNADDMDVKVLGTHFVVSSYVGSVSHAVLLEGSVSVTGHSDEGGADEVPKVLVPGQKASLGAAGIAVEEVDVMDYVGWRNGLLIFNNDTFSEIVKKIERKYDVVIQNNNPELGAVRFNGKFKDETLEELLETFKVSAGFEFRVAPDRVIIN